MKAFICLLAAALLCGCNKPAERAVPASQGGDFNGEGDDNSFAHRLAWFRAGAEFELLKACTNELVGITRVMTYNVDDSSDNLNKWTGFVVAEHVNSVGGIDRTNLYYKFSSSGHVFAIEDYEGRYAMERARRGDK